MNSDKESVRVLQECIDLQLKKSRDYQNPNSSIKQADYYPNGCMTLLDTIQAKVLRMRSVMEAMVNDPNYNPNFESLEDSAKDLINYASFFVAYSRGQVDGQKPDRDFLNRKKPANEVPKEFGAVGATMDWQATGIGANGPAVGSVHPGVPGNLVDVTVDAKSWSIGAKGSTR